MAELDYYKILGVPETASTSEIKVRYQTLAKQLHPDHQGDENLMSLINEAYSVLSDPQKRYHYNHPTSNQTQTSTAASRATAKRKASKSRASRIRMRRRVVVVAIVVVVVAGAGLFWRLSNNNTNTPDSGGSVQTTVAAQAAIHSMNQNYQPANHAYFTSADEASITSGCMSESAIASYPYPDQVKYCGCSLGEIEQNFTPDAVSEAEKDGTLSTLNAQNAEAIQKYCQNLL